MVVPSLDESKVQPAPATLARLLEDLGPGILHLLSAPRGLDVRVASAVIHDPSEPLVADAGDVVLAVGATEVVDVVRCAGSARAAAVMVKLRDADPAPLIDASEAAGVALVAVPDAMGWGQLHGLLRTSLAGAPAVGGVGGPVVGDLFALANAVAAMVGGAVTIEDPQSRVLAYSSTDDPIDEPRRATILGRRIPDSWMRRLEAEGIFKRLWTTDDVVRFEGGPGDELLPRLVTAVRAGGEFLGSIWVAEGRRPFTTETEAALREAARLAALHLIRNRASGDVERRWRGDLLRGVLEGRTGPSTAREMGLRADVPLTVLAFEFLSATDDEVAFRREQVLSLVTLHLEAFRRGAAGALVGGRIYVLLPTAAPMTRTRVVEVAREVVSHTRAAVGMELMAGVGSTVSRLADVPRSRSEADRVVRVLAKAGKASVAAVEDVRAEAILLELTELAASRSSLRFDVVDRIAEHDAKRGTSYLETLRQYLDCHGDAGQVSARIGIHPNTLRYRIRRLGELFGLDLDDPSERLAAALELRFRAEEDRPGG